MNDNEPEYEHSDLSGEFTQDGFTVLVDIFRIAGSDGGWSLEVINPDDIVTVWEEPFPSEQDAYEEFLATVERDGMESFGDDEPGPTVQ
ncbi:hypothetical protein [Pararhizobium sp.]|uniref:hypothetical protein n=1 Tax=Pararhizobium sp. TaxID=1977563 RepID=UPI002726293D|nr:hypothetical protein [Pararhizobium sp.]MDO9415586.1 hypothetical protein [Pararhizobium sp.]